MPNAFDGAGKEFQGPSLKAGVIILVAALVVLAAIWLAGSWAFRQVTGPGADIPGQVTTTTP